MKHYRNPFLAAVIAALWLWAPALSLRAIPLWIFTGRGQAVASDLPAASTVLAWYALESNGADTSGQSRGLTGNGIPDHGAGKVANCFTNTSTSEWYFRSSETWMSPAADFSITAWLRIADATPTANKTFFSHWNSTGNQRSWLAWLTTTGTLDLQVSSDGIASATYASTSTASDNVWVFVALVFDASTSVKIYLNGSLDSTNSTSIPAAVFQTSTQSMNLGSHGSNSAHTFAISGDMDEVALFDIALTAANVSALYNGGAGRPFSDLP